MFFAPVYRAIDPDIADIFRKFKPNRNCQPLPALGCFDPIAVLPVVFLILNAVKVAENIRPADFIKIAQPGDVLGLMNGNDQFDSFNFLYGMDSI